MRIADWLHGAMSSREFLVLVERLSDDSGFKTNAPKPFGRDGDWSEAMQIAAKTHDLLAEFVSAHTGGEYSVFLSPVERIKHAEALAEAERDSDLLGSVFERAGWSF